MKTYIILFLMGLLSTSCNGQKNDLATKGSKTQKEQQEKQPQGTWKVDKEFDKDGNLIRYDSIYSWSSNNTYKDLSNTERDSLIKQFKSRFFKQYSKFEDEGFNGIFNKDSLFSNHYFNDSFFNSDFGVDFMEIDKMTQQMLARQRALLEKYQTNIINPEEKH